MKPIHILVLLASHGVVAAIGFAAGIYALPILIQPPAPSEAAIVTMSANAEYSATFKKDLKGSDGFHWGEGTVKLGHNAITFTGELAPGPDYKLYLSPTFVETEEAFNQAKSTMVRVGEVKTFNNFIVELSPGVDLDKYNSVIVWCETFGEFITSAKYQ